jgi:predicted ATPase
VLNVRVEIEVPLLELVAKDLLHKNLLIIFDNCEYVVGICAEVAQMLLQTCSELHNLATSRENLNISGEFTPGPSGRQPLPPGRQLSGSARSHLSALAKRVATSVGNRPAGVGPG